MSPEGPRPRCADRHAAACQRTLLTLIVLHRPAAVAPLQPIGASIRPPCLPGGHGHARPPRACSHGGGHPARAEQDLSRMPRLFTAKWVRRSANRTVPDRPVAADLPSCAFNTRRRRRGARTALIVPSSWRMRTRLAPGVFTVWPQSRKPASTCIYRRAAVAACCGIGSEIQRVVSSSAAGSLDPVWSVGCRLPAATATMIKCRAGGRWNCQERR